MNILKNIYSIINGFIPLKKNIEKIYRVENKKLVDITFNYYIIIFLIFFINTKYIKKYFKVNKYLVIYSNRRKIFNDNIINIISYNIIDSNIRKPTFNKIIKINDKLLGLLDKRIILSHDYDENINDIYFIYNNEEIYKIEYNNNIWINDDIKKIKIKDL